MREGSFSVLLADDHPMARAGVRRLMEHHGIEVVGEAANGEEACRLYDTCRPDVVLMDLHMPGISGLEAIRRIRRRDAASKVLVFSVSESDALFTQAMALGVNGYLTKGASPMEIVDALRRVAGGEQHFDPALAGRLVGRSGTNGGLPERLTPRELEVFRLLALGHSVNVIARFLSISPKTVGVHHTRIMQKLRIRSPLQLVRLALQCGVVLL